MLDAYMSDVGSKGNKKSRKSLNIRMILRGSSFWLGPLMDSRHDAGSIVKSFFSQLGLIFPDGTIKPCLHMAVKFIFH